MPRLVRLCALWLPPIVLMAAIFALSGMPEDDADRGTVHFVLRKVGHFSEYALLALLWWRALRSRLAARTALVAALIICVAYAATDELHQTQVRGRHGTLRDVGIDAAGAGLALVLVARRGAVVKA